MILVVRDIQLLLMRSIFFLPKLFKTKYVISVATEVTYFLQYCTYVDNCCMKLTVNEHNSDS